jgi:predicted secreted hydrolase
MRRFLCRASLCLLLTGAALAQTEAPKRETIDADTWLRARPDYTWSFPRDHWSHPGYRSEWWYLTGHLQAADGRRFGYQFTFFRIGMLSQVPALNSPWAARDLIMGHAALTDLQNGDHHFSEVLYRATPLLGGFPSPSEDSQMLAWCQSPAGTPGRWTLRFNGDAFDFSMADLGAGFSLDLSTKPDKPLVFQGPGGFSAKATGAAPGASQYYSFTRLRTTGHVVIGADTVAVSGQSWMDKEFGSDKLSPQQTGWDWFSLQLHDGRDLMIYVLHDSLGTIDHASGTMVAEDGSTRYIDREDFVVEATDSWTSPNTGTEYPAGWNLRVDGESWTVHPLLADQENVGRRVGDLFYWEGAVEVRVNGGNAGAGYVELTGYGNSRRPGI